MPKYYCDYCRSYLTHDTMSVRKSHLSGKNHIRLYCQYYEDQAKQLGIWDLSDIKYEVGVDYLASAAPSPEKYSKLRLREREKSTVRRADPLSDDFCLPPPPNLGNLPPPPPSVLRHTEEYSRSIGVHMARQETNL